MKKIAEFLSVSFFQLNNQILYFKDVQGLWKGTERQLLLQDQSISRIVFLKNDWIVLDELNVPIFYSGDVFNIIKRVENIRISEILGDYVVYYRKKPKYSCGLLNLTKEFLIEHDKNYFEYYAAPNFYATFDNIVYASLEERFLWHFGLPEGVYDRFDSHFKNTIKGEITKIVGVHDGIIWVAINSGWLIGIDTLTGEERYNLYPAPLNSSFRFPLSVYTQLDAEKGVLFGLKDKFYWEIHLKEPNDSFRLYDISESCHQHNIRADMPIYDWVFQGNELFFGEIYDADHKQDTNTVGIFNREQRQIVWADRIGRKGQIFPTVQKIDYGDNRLYVLDGESTLHIFERE